MNSFEALTTYYSNYDEQNRLAPHRGQVEFLTTVHYIEKYLLPGMRILEIGAGTGRYSHYFARQGYAVDAVELIQHNIDVFRELTEPGEPVTVRQGNALDLSEYEDGAYDITLLLGPMYHLYTEADQRLAMSEAIRVTKQGGVVFAAYCNNDMVMYQFCFARGMTDEGKYRELIDPATFKARSTPDELFRLYRKEDVDSIMSNFKVERLHYVGTDMLTRFIGDAVDAMDEETFALYMKYHLCVCERSDMVGATNHMLDVFRKM